MSMSETVYFLFSPKEKPLPNPNSSPSKAMLNQNKSASKGRWGDRNPALLMSKEVRWFKHIGKRLPPQYKEAKNANGETPMMIFRREHKDLKKDGEEWMKTEAISNMIIALIAIAFVAALSVFLMGNMTYVTSVSENTRLLFTILRSIMFLTSTSSMMFFQSILISSFLEEDFHYKLPLKLMGGLVMLFLSLTSLLVAFGATISHLMLAGILPKIVIFASVPVFLVVLLKLKSLGETIHSWI